MPGTEEYLDRISALCARVKAEFGLSGPDTFLVVKDMVYRVYQKSRAEHSQGSGV